MTVVDVNVLLYAINIRSPHHGAARRWLTERLSGVGTVGFCWAVLLGFVRLGTNRSVLPNAMSVAQAFEAIDAWLAAPSAVVIEPTTRHRHVLRGLLEKAGTAGNLTMDAHLAALAVEHGAAVATFDRDFARFDIDVVVPD